MADAPKILATDTLRQSYPKLNQAIDNSNEAQKESSIARTESSAAVVKSEQAKAVAEDTQTQLNNIIIESGTSDAEVIQARGEAPVLNERLKGHEEKLSSNLLAISSVENKYDQFNIGSAGNGFITFFDDDGHKDVYDILKPMFDAYNRKFTSAIITSFPGVDPDFMDWEQIRELSNQGHEICSHTHSHKRLSELSSNEQIFELYESKRQLLSNGITPNHIAYPQGDYSNVTLENVQRFYKSGVATKITEQQNGLKAPLQAGKISRIGLGSWQDLTTEEIKNRVLQAKSEGRWIIFMTHVWANNSFPAPEGNVQAIQEVLSFCVDNGLNIVTYDEGFRRYCNKTEIGNNSITNKPYYIVGADYREYTNIKNLQKRVQSTSLGLSASPSEYELTEDVTVLYKELTSSEANSSLSPTTRAGMLITESIRIRTGYAKQTYKVFESDDMYVRTGKSDNTWGEWRQQGLTVYVPNSLTGLEPPSYFMSNRVTYKEIPGTSASNFPDARAGLLITERFGSSLGYAKQTYKQHQRNDVYVRSGNDNDTWTAWGKTN